MKHNWESGSAMEKIYNHRFMRKVFAIENWKSFHSIDDDEHICTLCDLFYWHNNLFTDKDFRYVRVNTSCLDEKHETPTDKTIVDSLPDFVLTDKDKE